VAEEGGGGPLGEFYFGDDFGAEPDVVSHFFGGDAFGPGGRPPFGVAPAVMVGRGWRSEGLRRGSDPCGGVAGS
jgi:hypothetical protein